MKDSHLDDVEAGRLAGPERPQSEEVDNALRDYRHSALAAGERPDAFWENQHSTISAKLQRSGPTPWRRSALVWVPIATAVVFCLFMFVETGKAPSADFAAGSDQDLLIDVERSVDQEYPNALGPVALIAQEMESDAGTTRR